MSKLVPNSGGEESDQLKRLLFEFIPARIGSLLRRPSRTKAKQLLTLVLLLGFTGLGFLYGLVRWR